MIPASRKFDKYSPGNRRKFAQGFCVQFYTKCALQLYDHIRTVKMLILSQHMHADFQLQNVRWNGKRNQLSRCVVLRPKTHGVENRHRFSTPKTDITEKYDE